MTIMVAEAGSAAAEAGASESTAGAGRAFRSRAGTPPARSGSAGRYPDRPHTRTRPRVGGRTQQGTTTRISGSGKVFPVTQVKSPQRAPGTAPAKTGGGRHRAKQSTGFADVRRATSGIRPGTPEVTNYEMVVLGEFVLAVLLTAATPFARPNQPGLSPYYGRDMIQLGALTVVYLILALMASTQRSTGRLAAWLGGLVLVTVGLGEAAALAKLLNVFGGGPSAAAGQAGSGGGSTPGVAGVGPAALNLPPAVIISGVGEAALNPGLSAAPTVGTGGHGPGHPLQAP